MDKIRNPIVIPAKKRKSGKHLDKRKKKKQKKEIIIDYEKTY